MVTILEQTELKHDRFHFFCVEYSFIMYRHKFLFTEKHTNRKIRWKLHLGQLQW